MTELDIEKRLRNLRDSLGRIKALLAWERLKRWEAKANCPWAFRLHDPTAQELKDEYCFFLALAMNTSAVLDQSSGLPADVRESADLQLADLQWQLHLLHLERRF